MPKALDTSMVKSLMTGKVTSTPLMLFKVIFLTLPPGDMAVGAVNGKPDQFAVQCFKFRQHGRERHKFVVHTG